MTLTLTEALQAALAAEHQVIYGYGVAGAHLRGQDRRDCLDRLDVHKLRRDALTRLLAAAGVAPRPARPAYALPFPVANGAAALALGAHLEDGAAGAFWDLTSASPPATAPRSLAVDALGDAATWAAHWRAALGARGNEPPLPGQP